MIGRWKRVLPRGSRLVDGSKLMNFMVVHWVSILEWSLVLSVLSECQKDHLVRNRKQVGWLCGAEVVAKTNFEIVLE